MPDEPNRRSEAAPPEPTESSVAAPAPRAAESAPAAASGGETTAPLTVSAQGGDAGSTAAPSGGETAAQRAAAPNPPLITAVEIENFKGVGRPMRVELRPITLLFGNNSAGKSTVLQALCYAHEVLNHDNVDAHTTELGGDRIDLGGFRNFVHAHDTTRAVRLRFELETWDFTDAQLASLGWYYRNADFEWGITDLTAETASAWVELLIELRGEQPALAHYEIGVNGALVGRLREREPLDVVLEFDAEHPLLMKETHRWSGGGTEPDPAEREGARLRTAAQAGRLRDAEASEAGGDWRLSYAEARLLARARPYWNQPLWLDVQGPAGAALDDDERSGFSALVSTLFLGIGKTLGDELARLRYIGPVRALHPPTRTASPPSDEVSQAVVRLLDELAATPGPRSSRAWADGSAAWTVLLETPFVITAEHGYHLIGDVSAWLERKDRLDTGYALRARSLVTIESSRLNKLVELAQQVELFDLARTNGIDELAAGTPQQDLQLVTAKTGLPVRLSDVGTGVSQVLPVVVAALDPNRPGVTAIEQPDLHLHPRVQVELGDLFAQGIGQGGIFLIETHSEHLLLRIMKRMRQTSDGTLPKGAPAIRPEDVAVFFVEIDPGGEETLIREMPLNERGDLVKAWPGGFFEEDLREIF